MLPGADLESKALWLRDRTQRKALEAALRGLFHGRCCRMLGKREKIDYLICERLFIYVRSIFCESTGHTFRTWIF